MNEKEIIKKFSPKLLQKKNVVMVGFGTKYTNGKDTGEKALVVGVRKKIPYTELASKDLVPEKIKGTVTDVIEVGEIKLLGVDRTKKYRPAPGGVSIGHYDITAGTLGGVVTRNGQKMILSNNHVLANINNGNKGDAILQPGPHDGGKIVADKIATLYDFVEIKAMDTSECLLTRAIIRFCNFFARIFKRTSRLTSYVLDYNYVDCAIAKPVVDGDVANSILEIGTETGVIEPMIGMPVKKSGRTSGLTTGKITMIALTVNVNMRDGRIATFIDQIGLTHMSEPGDSGSLIFSNDNKRVGLLFAGSDTFTIANRYTNVVDELNLD